uniref:Nucleolus and neural progenitor protein-like N-terminal domain-containing protein n=1 Tax=Oryza meridionalis TaxID=40149 RepID=A0A0E0E8N9_9ORYZ
MAERKEGEGKVVVVEEEEERRLRGALRNLQQEAGVLERLVYKHRNQHHGAAYFQYLLKVRRDVTLLLAAGLGDVLTAVFPVLASRKPANTILTVNRQSKKKPGANHCHHERLLGVARLLSEMLLDVVSVYNKASDLIDRKQSVKISIGGAQIWKMLKD